MEQMGSSTITLNRNFVSFWEYLPAVLVCCLMPLGLQNMVSLLWSLILLGVLLVTLSSSRVQLKRILIAVFLVRVFFIFADTNFNLLPYIWDNYHGIAIAIKKNLLAGAPLFSGLRVPESVKGYALFSSFLYLIFGDISTIVRITNAFFASLAVLRIYQICLEIFDNQKIALRSSMLFGLLPSFIVYSSLHMRDSIILLLSVDFVYRIIEYTKTKNLSSLFFLITNIALMYFFRPQNMLLFMFIGCCYVFVSKMYHRALLYKFSTVIVSIIFFMALLNWLDKSGLSKTILNSKTVFNYINATLYSRIEGGAAYLQGFKYTSWLDVFKYLPLRFVYFTFGPLPWHIDNLFMLLSFFEVLFLSFFIILTLKFWMLKDKANFKYILLLLLFGLLGLAANSLMDSNYGTAIRHRMNFVFVFLIFGSAYLQQFRIKLL